MTTSDPWGSDHIDPTDAYAAWDPAAPSEDFAIEQHRSELAAALDTALGALEEACTAIARLTGDRLYDVEFAEGDAGGDVATFVADGLRFTRAAHAITRHITGRN